MQHVNKKLKRLLDKIIEVTFLDHSQGLRSPIACRSFGRLTSVQKNHIVLTQWELPESDDSIRETNEEFIVIISSCITALRVLR